MRNGNLGKFFYPGKIITNNFTRVMHDRYNCGLFQDRKFRAFQQFWFIKTTYCWILHVRNMCLVIFFFSMRQFLLTNSKCLPIYNIQGMLTFSWRRSKASWRPTAFISVLWRAEVMYMCMSKKWPITPSCSDCSISNWESSLTNHSNDFWSRLIQKKSTLKKIWKSWAQ